MNNQNNTRRADHFDGEFVIFLHFASLHHCQSSHIKLCFTLPEIVGLPFVVCCLEWKLGKWKSVGSVERRNQKFETGIEIRIENLK